MKLHRFSVFGKGLAFAALSLLLIIGAEGSRDGAAQGVQLCLRVLIPSLFPFMAVTQLMIRSGLCRQLGAKLQKPARLLFGLSGTLAPVLLLSLLGGYPVGAGGIAALYRKRMIRAEEARHAALFMVCAGPGFVISFVGAVYQSRQTGLLFFAAQVCAVLLSGVIGGLFWRKAKNDSVPENKTLPLPFSQALVEAVEAAARGMFSVCAFVVLFSALTGILAQWIKSPAVLSRVYLAAEVCGAVTHGAKVLPPPAVAFAVGFGGLCVHCQLFAVLKDVGVRKGLFFVFRIIQGLLTALFVQAGMRLSPHTAAVFSTAAAGDPALVNESVLSGAVMLAVTAGFCLSVRQLKNR